MTVILGEQSRPPLFIDQMLGFRCEFDEFNSGEASILVSPPFDTNIIPNAGCIVVYGKRTSSNAQLGFSLLLLNSSTTNSSQLIGLLTKIFDYEGLRPTFHVFIKYRGLARLRITAYQQRRESEKYTNIDIKDINMENDCSFECE